MVLSALLSFKNALSDHLRMSFRLAEDIVLLGPFEGSEKKTAPNKIVVSLINIERETVSGLKFSYSNVSTSQYKSTKPAWLLNLYVMVGALFSEKQYEEGLQLLSGALTFIQNNNLVGLLRSDAILSIEPVNLSFSELSNLWSICGSTYYPSVLCKIRMVNVDSQEIDRVVTAVKTQDVTV